MLFTDYKKGLRSVFHLGIDGYTQVGCFEDHGGESV